MSDFDDKLIEFSAILDQYTASQRQAALAESKRNRITVVRKIGDDYQVHFEAIVDETAPGTEIYDCVARIDEACNRLRAKTMVVQHYERISGFCNQIDLSVKKLRDERAAYERKNAARSSSRRQEVVGLTPQQADTLLSIRNQIKDTFDKIEESRKYAADSLKILEGEDPLRILAAEIEERLDKLQVHRLAA
jgi:hypothetical protein